MKYNWRLSQTQLLQARCSFLIEHISLGGLQNVVKPFQGVEREDDLALIALLVVTT